MTARALACLLMLTAPLDASSLDDLMPVPKEIKPGSGGLPLVPGARIDFGNTADPRVKSAARRLEKRWETRTGLDLAREDGPVILKIECEEASPPIPKLGEDESYSLVVTPASAILRARTSTGALRGLATFEQLLDSGAKGWFLPAVRIDDAPRFPWRGLMLDVCRHWQPMDVVKRTLDGMAAVKLNVLHLHLTENQGFRIESKTHPELHEQGSDGDYFTQEQMREIIGYAAERGIRVVPEFDLPGHATSWLVSHPELASAPGPYAIERKWGVFPPTFDPTNEKTYDLLGDFLGEMAKLFPDPFLHIGGDEVEGSQWAENPAIRKFLRDHGLKTNADLQAYFNARLAKILEKDGKRMVGWDEILHPGLPKTSVIQSWRGADSLADAARQGYCGILSNGFYIDLNNPAVHHYRPDPLPEDSKLSREETARILGGEATMWSEWVTPETIDSRIWPRTAAIAERLWSPRDRRDYADLYRRLPRVSRQLEALGLRHVSYVDPMLRDLAGADASSGDLSNLRLVADIVEPVKGYDRGHQQPNATQQTSLRGLVDASRPDSQPSRELSLEIEAVIFDDKPVDKVVSILTGWRAASRQIMTSKLSPSVDALGPLFKNLEQSCAIGLSAAQYLSEEKSPPPGWREETLRALDAVSAPVDACELPFLPALRRLVVAADPPRPKRDITADEWRKQIDTLAATADND